MRTVSNMDICTFLTYEYYTVQYFTKKIVGRGGELEGLRSTLEQLCARISNSPLFKQLSARVRSLADSWKHALELIQREEVCFVFACTTVIDNQITDSLTHISSSSSFTFQLFCSSLSSLFTYPYSICKDIKGQYRFY